MTNEIEADASWASLSRAYGSRLTFAACDEHLSEALKTLERRVGTVRHVDVEDQKSWQCIDGHAPATWVVYVLGRHGITSPVIRQMSANAQHYDHHDETLDREAYKYDETL